MNQKASLGAYSCFFSLVIEERFDLHGCFSVNIVKTIVKGAIAENKIHVVNKFLWITVDIVSYFFLDGSKVHWLFDDIEVINNSKFSWINSLMEQVSILCFPTICYNFLCWLLPRLLNLYFINFLLINWIRVLQHILEVRILLYELLIVCFC